MEPREHVSTQGDLITAPGDPADHGPAPAIVDREPAQADGGLLFLVYQAWRRWWAWSVFGGVVLAAALAALVWLLFEPEYEASAWIRIAARTEYIAYQPGTGGGDFGRDPFVQTQVEMIQSPLVLERVLSREDIVRLPELVQVTDTMAWILSRLRVERVGDSELFQVILRTSSAKTSSELCNAIIDAYMQAQTDEAVEKNRRIIELLEQERRVRTAALEHMRNEIRALAGSESELVAQTREQLQTQNSLALAYAQLSNIEVEREVTKARLQAAREQLEADRFAVTPETIDQYIRQSPIYSSLSEQLAMQKYLEQASRRAFKKPENSPTVGGIKSDIAQTQQQLDQLLEEMRPELEAQVQAAMRQEAAEQVAEMETSLQEYDIRHQLVENRIQTLRESLVGPESESVELEFMQSDLKRAEDVVATISDRVEMLKTEQRAPSRVTALRMAVPPLEPVESIPLKQLLAACMFGLACPFALAVLWEKRVSYISATKQLSHQLELPVIGEIPQLPTQPLRMSVAAERRFQQSHWRFTESIHYLRTNLMLAQSPRDQGTCVAIVSAISGEGKTNLAVQLAISLAQAHTGKVLLIDGDMRSPDVQHMLDLEDEAGLSDVLSRQASFDDAVRQHEESGLDILTAGSDGHDWHELLNNGRLDGLLAELRRRYDYVFIDTPPLLAVADGLVFARACDSTLLCVRRDYSRSLEVNVALDRLLLAGANPLGTVLIGLEHGQRQLRRYGVRAYAEAEAWADEQPPAPATPP